MHQVGLQSADKLNEPSQCQRVDFPSLIDGPDRNPGLFQVGGEWPGSRERADMGFKQLTIETSGQQRELFLGTGLIECRDDMQ